MEFQRSVPRTRGDEPARRPLHRRPSCVPRTRGDEPHSILTYGARQSWSVPRTRGDEPLRLGLHPLEGHPVFPAHAGMNRLAGIGDQCKVTNEGVFPAHAGMNRLSDVGNKQQAPSVPRTRGDEPT